MVAYDLCVDVKSGVSYPKFADFRGLVHLHQIRSRYSSMYILQLLSAIKFAGAAAQICFALEEPMCGV
jgi:hypothetical protein